MCLNCAYHAAPLLVVIIVSSPLVSVNGYQYLNMPRLSLDTRRKVILLHNSGLFVKKIESRLSEENFDTTRRSLYR